MNYLEEIDMSDNNMTNLPTASKEVPIWVKPTVTLEEASLYFSIGINKLRQITDEKQEFVLWNGNKRLIKRKKFEEYLEKAYSI